MVHGQSRTADGYHEGLIAELESRGNDLPTVELPLYVGTVS